MGQSYEFITTWQLEASVEAVWDVLHDAEHYPDWWPAAREVRVLERVGDAAGVGSLGRYRWRGPLPYTLVLDVRVMRAERPHALSGSTSGDLRGTGAWKLSAAGGGLTTATFRWQVQTTKRWMNVLAPLLAPVFAWSHDRVMRGGEAGLAQHLRLRLRACG